MAVIQGDFDPEIIRKTRGVLDYYYYRGRLVVRSWPRKPVLPRSPNVQATAADFRDTARALSELPLVLQDFTREVVKGTSWTWRDAWTTALYGHNIEWGEPSVPPPFVAGENMLINRLLTSANGVAATINVNSTTYLFLGGAWRTTLDFDKFPATQFRILCLGSSNAVGQTITCQLAVNGAPTTPISNSGDDLVITNTSQLHESGWIDIAATLTGLVNLGVAMKGSNATVDINITYLEIQFYYPPPSS